VANTIKVKRGTNLSNAGTPAAGELIYKTDTNALYVGDGTTAATGLTAITGGGSGAVDSIANFANNRVLTASDSDSINGEANLTFNGNKLNIESSENVVLEIDSTSTYTFLDLYNDNDNRVQLGNANDGDFIVRTNDAIRLIVDSSGNTGIINELYHYGDTDTKMAFTADAITFTAGGETLLTLTESSQDVVKLGDGGDVDINLNDDMFIQGSSSNVGIGTTSPETPLHVNQDSNDHAFKVTGGGGGTIGGMSDVDLTDTSQGGIADGALLIYDASNTKFVPTNVLNNVTINGGSF